MRAQRSVSLHAALLAAFLLAAAAVSTAAAKKPFKATGVFVEGCSCNAPCACELTGLEHGCLGVGAMTLGPGSSYGGVDLAGAKIAYASAPGSWVRVYFDARDARQKQAAKEFASAVYSAFGKIEAAKDARIDIAGAAGKFTVNVDGGKTMKLTTAPVLGGDKKTPLVYSNVNDPLHPTVMQARTSSGMFKDGNRSFTLKGTNSYFANMKSSGTI